MVSGAPSSRDSSLPIQSPSDLAVAAAFEPGKGWIERPSFYTFSVALLGIGEISHIRNQDRYMSIITRRRVLQAAAGAIALGLTAMLSGCVGGAA
jgi:hypothetical protein